MSTGHLDQLLLGIADAQVAAAPGAGRIVLSGLTLDSRRVRRGDAFFALCGTQDHGIKFAANAVQRGAQVVLAEAPAVDGVAALDVPLLWIENLHAHEAEVLRVLAAGAPGSRRAGRHHAKVWFRRWTAFFMGCAQLWGYRGGRDFGVSHYLFEPRPRS